MIRNLKVLGLAMAAFFAMSAVVASAASAQTLGKITSDGRVTLTGVETGEPGSGANALTAFGLKVECPGSTYTGHKYTTESQTTHEEKTEKKHTTLITSGDNTATLTPHYKEKEENCKANGVFPVTIDMNGCDYVVHLGETTGVGDTYAITFDIVCPPGAEITVTAFTTAHDHTVTNKPFCVIHIPGQVGLHGGHATDTTNGHIDLTGTVETIKATRTASATHPALCPETTTTTGKFDLDVTVSGHNEVGGATPISLSH